jgi:hypothetical protein
LLPDPAQEAALAQLLAAQHIGRSSVVCQGHGAGSAACSSPSRQCQ